MRVEWAVACRFVEVHDGLATMVGAGVDNIGVASVPSEVGIMFAVRIAIAPGDSGKHKLTARVLNPQMDQIGELAAEFEIGAGQPHTQPGWEGHITVPLAFGWPVAEPGAYLLHFECGTASVDLPMMVLLAQDPTT